MMAATNDAKKSLEGNDAHTPSNLKNWGRMIRNGIKKSSWRESDKKMLIFTFPIHWKKLVTTIWNPTIGYIIMFI